MLASSSRHALKTTQRHAPRSISEVTRAHVPSSGFAGVQQHRNAATAQANATNTVMGGDRNRRRSDGLKHTPYSYQPDPRFRRIEGTPIARVNMQLSKAVEERNWRRVFGLCKEINKQGIEPDVTTYTHIMSACAAVGSQLEAQATFEDMLARGVRPTRQVFHEMLHACRYSETLTLLKIINMMPDYGIRPNEFTYEILVVRYAEMQQLELALQALHQHNALGLPPTLKTAQAVIKLAGSTGLPRLALDLAEAFEETSVRRLEHDAWVDCLIASAETLWEEGVIRTWDKVVHELNITPDEGLCIQVLHTAGRHGRSALALDAFRILGRIGVQWQEHHFAPVIEALCKEKRIKDALATLDMMRSHDITPLLETALPISNAVATDTDTVDEAWGYLEALREEGKRVDVSAINVVVRAAVILGDLQRAVGTYKAAGSLGVEPNVDTYNLLFAGCIAAQHRELGDRLLTEMKEADVHPDARTYERLIALCLTQANYEDAFFYLEEMKAEGHPPPRSVYIALIRKCVTLGDTRYKLAVEEMLECGYEVGEDLQRFIDSGGEDRMLALREAHPVGPIPERALAHKREEFMKGVLDAPLAKTSEEPESS